MHYNQTKYVLENYNENCFETFLEDPKFSCLKSLQEKIAEIPPEVRYEGETRKELNKALYQIIKDIIPMYGYFPSLF